MRLVLPFFVLVGLRVPTPTFFVCVFIKTSFTYTGYTSVTK